MKLARITYVLLAVFLLSFVVSSAQESRPKIAIKTFENPASYSRSTIGNGLTEILTTELQNTGKFDVLERSNIDELTKEMDFGNSDYAKSASFVKKGGILGAQYLLMGKVTNFGYSEHGERKQKINLLGPNTIVTVYQQRADVRVDFRLINVATAETVISQAGEAHATNTSEVSEMGLFQRVISGSITAEESSSLIGRATTDAVKDIVRKLNSLSNVIRGQGAENAMAAAMDQLGSAKGQIAAEEGGGLWIVAGLGSAAGLKAGDHLRVVHENVVKDKTGNIVYRKPVEIGSMEVTDVSQSDHAEARFTAKTSASTLTPQANDIVAVDMDFAKTLRGSPTVPTAINASIGNSAGSSSSGQLDLMIKRAESYIHDQFWSQALDQYNQAAKTAPADPRVLEGQALSHYMLGDFVEGDEIADGLLKAGGPFAFPVAHYHSMGTCTGVLTIQHGKLAYTGGKGDGFEINGQSLGEVQIRKISKGMVANEKIPDLPIINIRFRDEGGHEKDYQLLAYMYSKEQSLSGKNLASSFPMSDSDVHEMEKFEESVVSAIQKYVK